MPISLAEGSDDNMPPQITKYLIWPIAIAVGLLCVVGGGWTEDTAFLASAITAFFFTFAFLQCWMGDERGRLVNAMGIVALVSIILAVILGFSVA